MLKRCWRRGQVRKAGRFKGSREGRESERWKGIGRGFTGDVEVDWNWFNKEKKTGVTPFSTKAYLQFAFIVAIYFSFF
jgi:hypothetical protein